MTADITLVIGGVRSGKSRFAADLASRLAGGGPVLFVATARRGPSAGMDSRIETTPRQPARSLADHRSPARPDRRLCAGRPNVGAVLIDCLTIWISNIMYECGDSDATGFEDQARGALNCKVDALMDALAATNVPVVLVANEVGFGSCAADPSRSRVRRSTGGGQPGDCGPRQCRMADSGRRNTRPDQIGGGHGRARNRKSSPRCAVGARPAISRSSPDATPPV